MKKLSALLLIVFGLGLNAQAAQEVKEQGITRFGTPVCTLVSTSVWTTFWNPVVSTASLKYRSEFTVTEISTAAANMVLVWGSTTTPTYANTIQPHLLKPGISQSLNTSEFVIPWLLSLNAGVASETACMQESAQ